MNLYRSIPSNTTFLFMWEKNVKRIRHETYFNQNHSCYYSFTFTREPVKCNIADLFRRGGRGWIPWICNSQIAKTLPAKGKGAEAKNRCLLLSQNSSLWDLVSESLTEFNFDFCVFMEHCRADIDQCDLLPAKIGQCFAKLFGHNFQISAYPLNQWYFIYIRIPLIQWLRSILKIVAERFCKTPQKVIFFLKTH